LGLPQNKSYEESVLLGYDDPLKQRPTDRQHYSPEEHIPQPHHCENIKSSKSYESNLHGILKDECFLH
jgi:hypothetical protein